MAENERQNIFWIKTGECFAGKPTGSDITDYFYDKDGEPIQVERLKKLKADGCVSMEEPVSYEDASEKELNQLRETVKEQAEKIVDLENDLKTVPKNITAARKKIKELEASSPKGTAKIIKDLEEKLAAGNVPDPVLTGKVEKLEEQVLEKDIEIENSAAKVTELEAQIVELNKPDEETAPPAEDQPGPKKVKK